MSVSTDVFFSYHTESSIDIVEETAKILESFDKTSWYAVRNIQGAQNYTAVIPDAIKGYTLFVLMLNRYSMESEDVQREVTIAIQQKKPILIINLDGSTCNNSVIYISAVNSQMHYVHETNLHILAQNICEAIVSWFDSNTNHTAAASAKRKTTWDVNDLAFFGDVGERERIHIQHRFVYEFAKDTYDELLSNLTDFTFLDVGCNTGEQSKMFLDNKALKTYIGIDREPAALEQTKSNFPTGYMYLCDCEAEDFSGKLSEIEKELGISGFDVINISMVLLHTKAPSILIDVLSDHLSENGKIIILDIDDGFNIAYPDPDKLFEKAVHFCFSTEYSGFRHTGRAINKFLFDTDLSNITLHKNGLSTIGMSRKEREAFFDIYFWFILDDLRKMHEESPDDLYAKADYEWLKDNYSAMKNAFKKKDFFFNLGFMLYSAGPAEV